MTLRPTLAALIGLALWPAGANAQVVRLVHVGGGLLLPVGGFGDVERLGWQGSVTALRPIGDRLWLTLDAVAGRMTHQDGVAGHASVTGATLGLTLRGGPGRARLQPFVSAGGGLMRVVVAVPSFGTAATTELALSAGAGVAFGPGGRWWVAARWTSVSTSPQHSSFVPLSIGVAFPLGTR